MHPGACGSALYIRSAHGTETTVQILCSKNMLAPLKKVTLPRRELIAALAGLRLLNFFCKETGHDITKATLWSVSTVALGWIRNDPQKWKNGGTVLRGCLKIPIGHTREPNRRIHCQMKRQSPSYFGPLKPLVALLNPPDSVLIGNCFASRPGFFVLCDMRGNGGDLQEN
jgi:hypothetical protein